MACLHIHVLLRAFGDASVRRDVKARHSFRPKFGGRSSLKVELGQKEGRMIKKMSFAERQGQYAVDQSVSIPASSHHLDFPEMECSPYYQPPNNGSNVVCVFENPTWREEYYKCPAMGIVGSNLCVLFDILRNLTGFKLAECGFKGFLCRRNVCIVNAVREKYSSSNQFSSKDFDAALISNLDFIKKCVNGNKLVLCFGDRAEKAVEKAGLKSDEYVKVFHLSGIALSQLGNLNGLLTKYKLQESDRGLCSLIIIAQYIANKCCNSNCKGFSELVKCFSENGSGAEWLYVYDVDWNNLRVQCSRCVKASKLQEGR